MITSIRIQSLLATSIDICLLPILNMPNTQHLVISATMIPSSPINGIRSRIFEDNVWCKMHHDTPMQQSLSHRMETISKKLYQAATIPQRVLLSPWQCVKMDATLSIRKLVKHGNFHFYAYPRELAAYR